jgi:hypothetical protein
MDNIIQFPSKPKSPFPNNLEQTLDHVEQVRRTYCDEVTADAFEAVFAVLTSYGLTIKADEHVVKSVVFLEEAIRAMVYTTKDLEHTFQDLADAAITLEADAKKELDRIIEENQLHT